LRGGRWTAGSLLRELTTIRRRPKQSIQLGFETRRRADAAPAEQDAALGLMLAQGATDRLSIVGIVDRIGVVGAEAYLARAFFYSRGLPCICIRRLEDKIQTLSTTSRVAIASDHAGFALKEAVRGFSAAAHREILDR
jgi:hypothetical protein